MAATCGNCGNAIAATDVTCPTCGVLLAAYAPPAGSDANQDTGSRPSPSYAAPPPPPSATETEPTKPQAVSSTPASPSSASTGSIFSVPDYAKPPTGEDPTSSTPKPLFDMELTVDQLKEAAEGDHTTTLIVQDAADALPQDGIDDIDAYVADQAASPVTPTPPPVIDEPTSHQTPAQETELAEADVDIVAVDTTAESDDDLTSDEFETEDATEWESDPEIGTDLDDRADAIAQAALEGAPHTQRYETPDYARQKPRAAAKGDAPEEEASEQWLQSDQSRKFPNRNVTGTQTEPAGQTEDYLRKLHQEAGYAPQANRRSKPVAGMPRDRHNPSDRQDGYEQTPAGKPLPLSTEKIHTGCVWIGALVVGSILLRGSGLGFFPFLAILLVGAYFYQQTIKKRKR